MLDGKYSFGSGGYFRSAVDELLPVSMELRQDHRKLAVAMAIVMDRSGSMSAGVPGTGTKMDLANTGATAAIELLGEQAKESAVAIHSGASAEGDKQKLEGEGYEHLKARNLYGESEAGTYSKYVERRELEMQVTNPHTLSKVNLYIDFNKNNLTLMEDRNIIAERLPLELFDDFIDESIDIKSQMDDRKDRGEPPF